MDLATKVTARCIEGWFYAPNDIKISLIGFTHCEFNSRLLVTNVTTYCIEVWVGAANDIKTSFRGFTLFKFNSAYQFYDYHLEVLRL
jgi:hypothetical protein